MSTNAITEKQEGVQDRPSGAGGLGQPRETAPSVLREDEAGLPRTLGMIGGALVIFGGMALAFNLYGRNVRVGTGWASVFLALGIAQMLFHAAFDRDVQVRRMYMAFGYALLLVAVALCLVPYPRRMGDNFRWGVPMALLSLLFLLAFLRNETDPAVRNFAELLIGGVGAVAVAVGLIGGNVHVTFLLPYGMVLAMVGLIFVCAFVGVRGVSDELAYRAGLAIAAAGLLVVLVAVGRSLLQAGWFQPSGFLLLVVGLVIGLVGVGLYSDWPVLVLTRRELGGFFYSPIAYFALFGSAVLAWGNYWIFLATLSPDNPPLSEPIVRNYIFDLFPVITVSIVVPLLTMRLLSEEQRSGTLEVLLTAPVSEASIVLSKFLAGLVSFMVVWIPFALYLLAIPLSGGSAFDYRPLLSFSVALAVSGAAFTAMGLFFSSLTRNQIASAVLTFAGMLGLLGTYLAVAWFPQAIGPAWSAVLTHVSYLNLWNTALEGKIVPRFLLSFVSMTVLFLFLTWQVLESRKWR